jgi:hypothetical protein
MTLEEFTGKPTEISTPQTAKETEARIMQMLKTTKYQRDWDFVDDLAVLLAAIGEESLNPQKIVGQVGYQDSPLKPEWAYKENMYPFHIKDSITGENVADPRVILIGKFIHKVGSMSGHGHEYMYELYVATAKIFHSYISPLNYAWNGIFTWRS